MHIFITQYIFHFLYENQQPMARVLSASGAVFFFLSHIFILLISQAFAQLPGFLYHFCLNDKGNYTGNSIYRSNLNHLLSTLPSQDGNGYGFYNLSYGNSSDEVYAIGLCRGDVKPNVCRNCLNNATQRLRQDCSNQKEAVGWYDYCMLRYSNRSMLGVLETNETFFAWSEINVTSNVEEFTTKFTSLLTSLKNEAASEGSLRKFATGNSSATDAQTLYALVQCTPDLSLQDCNNCLDLSFTNIPTYFKGRMGGRVVGTNCNFRYEASPFYEDEPVASLPPPPSTNKTTTAEPVASLAPPPSTNNTTTAEGRKSNTSIRIIVAVVSGTAAVLLLQ